VLSFYVETLRRPSPRPRNPTKCPYRLELLEIRHRVQNRTVGAAEGEERTPQTTVLGVETTYNLIADDKSKISWKGCVLF